VPTEQLNYIMVRSIFEKGITYADSIFYDASTWSIIHAYNLPYTELKSAPTKGKQIVGPVTKTLKTIEKSSYAYLIELTDYNAHKALYQLQKEGAIVQTSFKSFTLKIGDNPRTFDYGTLVIPANLQKISSDSLFNVLKKVSRDAQVDIVSVNNGYSIAGVDLGSGNIKTVKKPEALMVLGTGVSGYEAGEVWHLLDQRIGMPITKAEMTSLSGINLNRYNTLVMVSGQYQFDSAVVRKIKAWIQNGGTLITFKTASEWAIKQNLIKEQLITDTTKIKRRINYEDAADWEGAKAIGGSIFQIDLDISHPIGFGFSDRKVSVYRNGSTFLKPGEKTYNTVAQYTANPLIGGYLHRDMGKYIANSVAILVSEEGAGRVILFADNPNFRAVWYGTNKLFLNALFFGSNITSLSNRRGEED
jgi:hypothetical protein